MKKLVCRFDSLTRIVILLLAIGWFPVGVMSQSLPAGGDETGESFDKCRFDPIAAEAMLKQLGPGYGYNYDSLRIDLQRWRTSPFVQIDSVGASVQDRALWLVTIEDTMAAAVPRWRIWIHARTHPGEVQAWWVTREMMRMLLDETPLSRILRRDCVFNIMPMYNPDGVELGHARTNANGVDIESNWNKPVLEPEVLVLKAQFERFMASESPIRVQLNMHSAFACRRFFVYHHENGTSPAYAFDERQFIGEIVKYWPGGIEPWNYSVTWTNSTPTQYPESWFWLNHGEAVMALTYEDMNCEEAGEYDRTAGALLEGIADYLELDRGVTSVQSPAMLAQARPAQFSLQPVYPNPLTANRSGVATFTVTQAVTLDLKVYDMLGREYPLAGQRHYAPGEYALSLPPTLASGQYFLVLQGGQQQHSRVFMVVR